MERNEIYYGVSVLRFMLGPWERSRIEGRKKIKQFIMKLDNMNPEKCVLDSILAINLDYNKFFGIRSKKCLLFVDIFMFDVVTYI